MLDEKKEKYWLNNHWYYLVSAAKICLILSLIILAYVAPASMAADSEVNDNKFLFFNHTDSLKHNKIESSLLQEKYKVIAEKTSTDLLPSDETEEVDLIEVVFKLNSSDHNYLETLKENGAIIKATYRDLVYAQIPVLLIEDFSELQFVQYIRDLYLPLLAAESQGVGVINADDLHDEGITGENVKIAVIDKGFYGYNSNSEIPGDNIIEAKSFTGDITGGGEIHGTACAEIVLDVAPEAGLYLLNFNDESGFRSAVNYAIDNDVDVITCSIGWLRGPFDGTGVICEIADEAYDNDILFINSIGNQALRHWEGSYNENTTEVEGETWYVHDFKTGDVTNSFTADTGRFVVTLSWNDWPVSDNDYDLYLVDQSSSTIIASSENAQTGTQEPYESIDYDVTTQGEYGVIIRERNSDESVDFELYSFYHHPEYNVESSSLVIPADSAKVMAVGATDWSDDSLEYYSSRGPTNDGRTKPDVVAPDNVLNSVYGSFRGTSASAPHVAGAAALMLSVDSSLTPDEIQSTLESTALDLGAADSFGSGRIDVYQAVQELDVEALVITNINNDTPTINSVTITWNTDEDSDSLVKYRNSSGFYEESDPVMTQTHSLTLTGLCPDTEYFYRVNSTDSSNNSNQSDEYSFITAQVSDTTAPILTNINNDTPTINSVTITWNTDEDSDSLVKYRNSSGFYEESDPVMTQTHSLTLTGLCPDTEYFYRVNSTDSNYNSNQSDEYSFITAQVSDTTAPILTNINNDTPTINSVTITWNTDEDSDSLVKYRNSSGFYEESDPVMTQTHSLTLTGLCPDTEYFYRVNSTDSNYNSNQSDEYSFITAQVSDTTAPILTNINNDTPTINSVTITWNTDEDSDSLVKYRNSSGFYEESDPVMTQTHSLTLTGLCPDTEYFYRVNSTDSNYNSNQSDEYSFITAQVSDTTAPILTNINNDTPTINSVTITWNTNEDSDSLVKYRNSSGFYEESDPVMTQTHSLTLTGLCPDTEYFYRVNSTDSNYNSNQSDEYSFITAQVSDTTAPILTNINNDTPTINSVTITWNTNEDSDSLVKYRNSSGFYEESDPVMTQTHSIILTGLCPDTEYFYRVNSTDSSNNSNQSDEYSFITAQVSDTTPPIIISATADPPVIEANGTDNVLLSIITIDQASSVAFVILDLSAIGGSSTQALTNNSGIWQFITNTTIVGDFSLPINATDNAGNSNISASISLSAVDTTLPLISNPDDQTIEQNSSGTINWTVTVDDPGKYWVLRNGEEYESADDYESGVEFSININTTSIGLWNYTIFANDTSDNTVSDQVNITINESTGPLINNPLDQTIEQDDACEITWIIIENDPGQYRVLRNGEMFVSPDTYISGIPITLDINTSHPGIWNYTIIANDTFGNIASDQVNITVNDTTTPLIISATANPSLIEANGIENTLLNVTTNDAGSSIASVIVNLSAIGGSPSQSMIQNNNIWQFVTNTTIIGDFILPVNVTDHNHNSNTSHYILLKSEDTIPPIISTPADKIIEQTTSGNITWNITEIHPARYRVLRNGTQVTYKIYESGNNIIVPINTIIAGDWNYTIIANDTSENIASDQVNISINDTSAPIIIGLSNQLIEVNASGNIIWKITDANPDQYRVLRNGSQIRPPTNYGSVAEVNIPINISNVSKWRYTIIANDTAGNNASSTVIISVQETISPVITSPPNQSIERCTIENITWIVTDSSPDKYWIFENDVQVVPPSDFKSGHAISYHINTSGEGLLNYTIFANDTSTSGIISSDQVEITVVEEKPLSVSITSPSDGYYTTSMTITVSGTVDGNCSIPTVSVNGNEAQLELDNGCVGTFSASSIPLNIGTNFITATATNNNSEHKESNTIEVTRRKVIRIIRINSGGGGGGGGSSSENFSNILISETQREFLSLGENVVYHFNADGNIIMNINFTGLISAGIIPAKVEILNDTSSLVNYAPLDTVYKNVNIWVGNLGWATSKNIDNSTISFKVDKSWVNENSIDTSFIRMNHFFNGQWNPLPTFLTGQDDEFFYFICETQGFSSFAVTGKSASIGEAGAEGITVNPSAVTQNETLNNSTAAETSEKGEYNNKVITILVFGLFAGLMILLIAVLSRQK